MHWECAKEGPELVERGRGKWRSGQNQQEKPEQPPFVLPCAFCLSL